MNGILLCLFASYAYWLKNKTLSLKVLCFLLVAALKSNIMAALNKEVKSLDDDNWMFEGPRSRINLMSRQGQLVNFLTSTFHILILM